MAGGKDEGKDEGRATSHAGVSVRAAAAVLILARLAAALFSNISDCDETYNYWEPTHYLVFGSGFQTWEYSPVYAIRSYAYVALHAGPAGLVFWFTSSKVASFYAVRVLLGLLCAAADTSLYAAVCRSRLGTYVGNTLLFFLALAPGMFISSAAFLPSSFAMCTSTLALAAWIAGSNLWAVFFTAAAAIIGWPFSGALGVPIALDIVLRQQQLVKFILYCLLALALLLVPLTAFDTWLYRRLVVAPVNIVLYNVFASHSGSELYGVEPWTFYPLNVFLNFNVVAPLAALAIPLTAVAPPGKYSGIKGTPRLVFAYLLPAVIWLLIFWPQPHKEERFLFPIYPQLCLAAAIALHICVDLAARLVGVRFTNVLKALVLVVFATGSLSRIGALYTGYHAPLDVYEVMSQLPGTNQRVCVGKEWYRYGSSFFLPEGFSYNFLQSEFRGQLPQAYAAENGTWVIPDHMNDLNKEEPTRYVSEDSCDFIVDVDLPSTGKLEPRYSEKGWKRLYCQSFIDPGRSHRLFRAFYVPVVGAAKVTYADYCLLQRPSI